jgi:thiamine-monophosphate kinase
MRERRLIERIRKMASSSRNLAVVRGIGDDCAVLRLTPGNQLLVTTDLSIENVHFRREWNPPASVGHKCLTRGLSDIAAMGGTPIACFLSLGLPPKTPRSWVDGFFTGLLKLARRYRVQLAGGDISSARQIVGDIAVAGQAPASLAVLRSGARPGDRIYVTGRLGGSAAVLKQLLAGEPVRSAKARPYFYPEPRIEVGRRLQRRGLATAMIDLSDGLSVDLAHICAESRVSAVIHAVKLPIANGSRLELALHGGEDYELLFTAGRRTSVPGRIAGLSITEIGEVRNRSNYSSAIQILGENGKVSVLPQRGWEHFRK